MTATVPPSGSVASLAAPLLTAAKGVLDQLIATLETDDPTATVVSIETETFDVLIDFVPSAFRPEVGALLTPLLDTAEAKLNPDVSLAVKNGLAIAKVRIDALL